MTHGGSGDPTDLTAYNAIHALIEGKSAAEVADEIGWGLEDVLSVHPENITRERLIEIADEHRWPKSYAEALINEIQLYLIKKSEREPRANETKSSIQKREEETEKHEEVIPMIGMTHREWHKVLQQGLENKEAEDKWRETVAQYLNKLVLPPESSTARQELLGALRNDPDTDERFAQAVQIMIKLIPLALDRTLGVKGHLLSSASREYPMKHDLLQRAIKDIMQA